MGKLAQPATLAGTGQVRSAAIAPGAQRWLRRAGACWLTVAVAGQLFFATYVIAFYGGAAARGTLLDWNKVLGVGYLPGQPVGNAVLALHLLFTVVIVALGGMQLVPALRRAAPTLHRWSGRLYLASAAILALGGLFLLIFRGTVGDFAQQLATGANGLLIVAFAALTLHHARARRFNVHRRWALRLFLAVAGVWFFRLMLSLWLLVFQAPIGFDADSFTGPLLVTIAWGQFILPLAVLELYLSAERGSRTLAIATTALVAVLSVLTAVAIVAAALILWLPRM